MKFVHYGVAIHLARIGWTSSQQCACLLRFRDSCGRGGRRPRSVVQIQQDHLVAKRSKARDRASTAVFRIAGVAAGYDHLHFRRGSLVDRTGYRFAEGRTGSQSTGADEYISSRYWSHANSLLLDLFFLFTASTGGISCVIK